MKMALTLISGLTLMLLTIYNGFAQGQESVRYPDLLKQSHAKLLHKESKQDLLNRYNVTTVVQVWVMWNYQMDQWLGKHTGS